MNLIRTRRPLAVLFAATLTAASLAGCGALTSSKDEGNPSNSATASSAQPSDSASPAPTTAPAPGPTTSAPAPANPGTSGGPAPQPGTPTTAPPAPEPTTAPPNPAPAPAPAPGPQDPNASGTQILKPSLTPFTEEEKQQAVKITITYAQARLDSNWAVACELAAAESNGGYFVLENQVEKNACVRAASQNIAPVEPNKAQAMREALNGAAFTVEERGDGTAAVKSEELGMGFNVVKLEGKGIYIKP